MASKKTAVKPTAESHTFPHIKHAKKRAFLSSYSACGNVSDAARASGISRFTHYDWLKSDADYAAAFAEARETAADYIQAEIYRRGVEGIEEPIFYKGEQVGSVRRYSDKLLIVLAKALRPEQFRDNLTISMGELHAAIERELIRIGGALDHHPHSLTLTQ